MYTYARFINREKPNQHSFNRIFIFETHLYTTNLFWTLRQRRAESMRGCFSFVEVTVTIWYDWLNASALEVFFSLAMFLKLFDFFRDRRKPALFSCKLPTIIINTKQK